MKLYSKYAGIFDVYFTEQDYKVFILILFTWLVKMYIQRQNVLVSTPKIDDYISTLLIQYLTTGILYELLIYHNKALALFLIPMTFISIFSLDFILFISADEENKIKVFKSITTFITNKVSKFLKIFK